MALCSDPANQEKCRAFAQTHGLEKGEKRPPPEVLKNAKNDLGCDSESSCMNFCQKPENQNKCFEFAKKNGFMKEEDAKHMEDKMEQKKQMMEAAKTELGCESFESCGKICEDPANRDKCVNMGKKFGMIKEEIRPKDNNNTQKPPMPCTSETECKKYCETHPEECPGMGARPNTNASNTALDKPLRQTTNTSKGDFLGPSGCKTEDECKAYCEKHPGECPGFPKKLDQPKANPSTMPESFENITSKKTNGKNRPPVNKQNSNPQDFKNEMPNNAPNNPGISQPPPNQYMNPPQQGNSNQNPPPPNPSEFAH